MAILSRLAPRVRIFIMARNKLMFLRRGRRYGCSPTASTPLFAELYRDPNLIHGKRTILLLREMCFLLTEEPRYTC